MRPVVPSVVQQNKGKLKRDSLSQNIWKWDLGICILKYLLPSFGSCPPRKSSKLQKSWKKSTMKTHADSTWIHQPLVFTTFTVSLCVTHTHTPHYWIILKISADSVIFDPKHFTMYLPRTKRFSYITLMSLSWLYCDTVMVPHMQPKCKVGSALSPSCPGDWCSVFGTTNLEAL